MTESTDWQFDIDVHPIGWIFPAGKSWVAGWLRLKDGTAARDVRAWLGARPLLSLHGLPRPDRDRAVPGSPTPPYSGFSLLFAPPAGARLLRLELLDQSGTWREFFRTSITPSSEALVAPPMASAPNLAFQLVDLMPRLLRLQQVQPGVALGTLASNIITGVLAEPLNALPNPPFYGALEEPRTIGRVRYGRLLITGWLAHRTAPIKRLTAVLGAGPELPLYFGRPRPDIAGVFSDLPREAQLQFVGHTELPALQGGPILLNVFAELPSGEKHLVFAQRFFPQIIAGADTPMPGCSPVTFAGALWALCRAARRHTLPLGLPGRFLNGAREAWAAFRAEAPVRSHPKLPASVTTTSSTSRVPLRLLVVTHNLNYEGAPRLVFELACHLAGTPGARVQVLSPQDGPMRRDFEAAGMPVKIIDLSAAFAAPTPEQFHAALRLAVSLDWSNIDLVLANTMVSFWAVHLALGARKPSLFYVHESSPIRRFFAPTLTPGLFPLVESAFQRADRVVFTADASRRIFAYLERPRRFTVCPSWLDVAALDSFRRTHARDVLRTKHAVPANALVVLNLGSVCERKGQHVFVAAAAIIESQLRSLYPQRPVEFIMVGARQDEFTALLQLQAAAAGLQHVRFVPETKENLDWLHLSDLLVCSSFEESSPRVVTEAAVFGLPIVSTDVNGIPELVTTDEAWLVAPGNPGLLADAICQAISAHIAGDVTRQKRARQTVVARFDSQISLPQHLALAREVASTHRKS